MMHTRNITGNKIEAVLDNPIKTDLIIPESAEYSEEGILSHKEQSDLHNQQNKLTIELLEKAVVHVRQYDSLETASKIVAKAFHRCPSMYNRNKIVEVQRSLKAAIKADKWAKSRRRRRHVDESTVRRNIDTFYEKLASAVETLRLDLDKRSLTLFSKVKKQFQSVLPMTLPADSKAVKKSAHVIVMSEAHPKGKHKYTRLEGNLFLIENVSIFGVNRKAVKDSFAYAEKLGRKHGFTIYSEKLVRPSENIDWFLVLDFGVNITFASFADKMEAEDDPDTNELSFEGYLKRQTEEKKAQEKIKTKRLRDVRQAFIDDNIMIFEDIKTLQNELDNLAFERGEYVAEFSSLTILEGSDRGLEISQIGKLYDNSMAYRRQLMHEGYTFDQANRHSIKQRIEAKACYYDYVDATHRIREIKQRIVFLNSEIEQRKIAYVRRLGMVSTTKYIDPTLD